MKCAYCGKQFRITASGWGYAYSGMYTCSYKCMRAMEREDGIRMLTDEQKKAVEQLRGEGLRATQIADRLQVSAKAVGGYISGKMHGKQDTAGSITLPVPQLEISNEQPVSKDVRAAVVHLIQDMLDVLKKVYGL